MKRYGMVIGVHADRLEEYKRLHASVWPEVWRQIEDSNMRNFTVFERVFPDGAHYLFMYYEYVGADYEADMARMAADPATREWWKLTEPCQKPLANRQAGEWWAAMEEVCHHD
jgi:L-rhamnose mutarotase